MKLTEKIAVRLSHDLLRAIDEERKRRRMLGLSRGQIVREILAHWAENGKAVAR